MTAHDSPTTAIPAEMPLDEALAFATRLHRVGELDAAETLYRRILDTVPEHADALNFLGIARHQRGHTAEAVDLMQRSLARNPRAPGVWNNLGNILVDIGRFDEAGEAYEQVLHWAPDNAELFNNLGVLRRAQQRLGEAEAAYRQAIVLKGDYAEAHNNLGNLLAGIGRLDEAVREYCEAITLIPSNPSARKMLGFAYYTLGRYEEAAGIYRAWLEQEPDSAAARHHLAACTGQDVPERAADAYVEATFDGFADSFDVKLEMLTYRAPQLVAERVAALAGTPAKALRVLDAGCGTGLCGPLLAPWARGLVGVDLSMGMLRKAEARGVYDELVKAELTAFLEAAEPAAWDLVVSADTLCYFGVLDAVFVAGRRALAPAGWLVFTVEAEPEADEGAAEAGGAAGAQADAGHVLKPHGRYAHRRGYVERALAAAGFGVASFDAVMLRSEGGRPVQGWLAAASISRS
ncbi:tetratricopeptide repeat protein [Derxia gummosa]|uniref:Tetratricopeptide repeat protein n=1 Tax=Derxia gummosa DSM 723 TaxID=1121388 RepID=A0A8B6X909_9BURK|nr:tetratricopeptide repeat protein [Derxia gummosa]